MMGYEEIVVLKDRIAVLEAEAGVGEQHRQALVNTVLACADARGSLVKVLYGIANTEDGCGADWARDQARLALIELIEAGGELKTAEQWKEEQADGKVAGG